MRALVDAEDTKVAQERIPEDIPFVAWSPCIEHFDPEIPRGSARIQRVAGAHRQVETNEPRAHRHRGNLKPA